MASIHEASVNEPLEWDSPLYRTAVAQFDQAGHADIDPDVAERLRYPERAFIVSCPVRLDRGRRVVFAGYRVQHSSVLGPTKGGIRYDAEVTLGECAALAVWMTWKCALLRLPYGGAKGGVRCSPREMSQPELERLTRRFTSELLPIIGPKEDIPAPDMATNEQTMAWMIDVVVVPIGGGGLDFRRVDGGEGVQPEDSRDRRGVIGRARHAEERRSRQRRHARSRGLHHRRSSREARGEKTHEVVSQFVDEIVTLPDEQIFEAVLWLMHYVKVVPEGVPRRQLARCCRI